MGSPDQVVDNSRRPAVRRASWDRAGPRAGSDSSFFRRAARCSGMSEGRGRRVVHPAANALPLCGAYPFAPSSGPVQALPHTGLTPQLTATQGTFRSPFERAAVYPGATMLGHMIGFFMLPLYAHTRRDISYAVIGVIDAGLMLVGSLLT